MILTTGTGLLGVVTEKQDLSSTYSKVEIRTKEVDESRTHFVLEIYFDALHDRKVTKLRTLTSEKPLTREALNAICQERCEKIAKAQMRARKLWLARKPCKPIPAALRQSALKQFFPESSPTKAQWLARVTNCEDLPKATRSVLKKERLAQFIAEEDFNSVEEYFAAFRVVSEHPGGATTRARILFLFSHYKTIARMTAQKAHKLAQATLGHNNAGHLASFQKLLQRMGIKLRPPGRPKN